MTAAPLLLLALLCDGPPGDAPPGGAASPGPVPLIFDTDLTGDVDDVLALAMVHALADRRECELLAVTISKVHPLAAPFADALNTMYGRPDVPVGATRDGQRRDSRYLHLVERRKGDGSFVYPHDLLRSADAPPAVDVLRATLAAAADRSVVIVQVGLATNLADLLDSGPDAASPLTGRALVGRKVRLVSAMAGAFAPVTFRGAVDDREHREANVRNGVPAMRRFADGWPDEVPVVWSGFNVGLAAPYPRESVARDFAHRTPHLVREAYLAHSGPDHDRPSWDLTSVLHAVRPDEGYFRRSEPGRVSFDARGVTAFAPAAGGRDRFLILDPAAAGRVVATQRALVSQPPLHAPPAPSLPVPPAPAAP